MCSAILSNHTSSGVRFFVQCCCVFVVGGTAELRHDPEWRADPSGRDTDSGRCPVGARVCLDWLGLSRSTSCLIVHVCANPMEASGQEMTARVGRVNKNNGLFHTHAPREGREREDVSPVDSQISHAPSLPSGGGLAVPARSIMSVCFCARWLRTRRKGGLRVGKGQS